MSRNLSRLLLTTALAWVALLGRADAAAAAIHLPVVLAGAPVPPTPSAPSAPPRAGWSRVLRETPLPSGWRLDFFEARPLANPPEAVAEHVADDGALRTVGVWYRDQLPPRGWRLVEVGPGRQRWERGSAWLTVEWFLGEGSAGRLSLAREIDAVTPAQGLSLTDGVPLPAGAWRMRYDRRDLLTEEVGLAMASADARAAMERVLAAAGWLADASWSTPDAAIAVYRGAGGSLTIAVWQQDSAYSVVGLGTAVCEPRPTEGARLESVYLEGVPAPPDSNVAGYERDAIEGAAERWIAACGDLDVLGRGMARRWLERDWRVDDTRLARRPGRLDMAATGPTGREVRVRAQSIASGGIDAVIVADRSGRRQPGGASLLWPDVLLPPMADAVTLVSDPDAPWPAREVYQVEARSWLAWFRAAMPQSGWRHERDGLYADWHVGVYYAGGEELVVGSTESSASLLDVARRRVCASDTPLVASGPGSRARHLAEMPVVPGATYMGHSGLEERYTLTCAGMDDLAAWYREAMESGAWSLAMTVGPEDRFERTLLFVRPDERHLSPDQRTAWGEVVVRRVWPYHYELVLRRDPGGVMPFAAAR